MSKINPIITAELRALEKRVSLGEISYGRMVEIFNERMEEHASQFKQDEQSDAVEFSEWLHKNECIKRDRTHPKYIGKWWSGFLSQYYTIQELYTLFKDEQLKKK